MAGHQLDLSADGVDHFAVSADYAGQRWSKFKTALRRFAQRAIGMLTPGFIFSLVDDQADACIQLAWSVGLNTGVNVSRTLVATELA